MKTKPLIFAVLAILISPLFAGPDEDLHKATQGGNIDAMAAALKAGANIESRSDDADGSTSLIIAAKNGNLKVVEFLVKSKADVNAERPNGWTALIHASCQGHLPVVKYLIKNKANVNHGTEVGITALYAMTPDSDCNCAKKGDKKIIQELKKAGAKSR